MTALTQKGSKRRQRYPSVAASQDAYEALSLFCKAVNVTMSNAATVAIERFLASDEAKQALKGAAVSP